MAAENADRRPRTGIVVELHESDGKSSLGRVQPTDSGRVSVAVATHAAIAVDGRPGAAFEMVWPVRDGVSVLPVTVAERHGASQIEVWEFDPAGEARFEQRRLQPRIAAPGPIEVQVHPELDAPGTTLMGTLVDVSEAALQCVIDIAPDDPVVISGTSVRCRFAVGAAAFDLAGTVHAAWTAEPPPRLRVVVRFDAGQTDLPALAELLRAAAAAS